MNFILFLIYHLVYLHCTFSKLGSVNLALQLVPELLIISDALL